MENTPLYNKIMRVVKAMLDSGVYGDSVTITPALNSGTKIADYTINDTAGELYTPDIPDISDLATESYVDNAVSDLATESYVDNAVSDLASETYVDNAVSDLATETYVDNAVSGLSSVSITPYLSSGTKVADYSVDGVAGSLYAPDAAGGDTVVITPAQNSGTKVADYSINGNAGVLYAPSISGLATETYVDNAIGDALDDYATETYVDTAVGTKLAFSDLKRTAITSASISLSANGYAWGSITVPATQKLICPIGYWIKGTSNTSVMVYAFYQETVDTIQIGLRTWANSGHTVTVEIQYLYIDA